MNHFLSVCDCTETELRDLIQLAGEVKAKPGEFSEVLTDKNIGLLFMKPSTRTRVSFEVGINQLGGSPIVLSSRELQLGRGETVADTARVLSRYLDGLMARVFGHKDLVGLAEWGSIGIINGLSDLLHPCQALCDFFTLSERFGQDLSGLKFAYIGDGNNMAHSLMLAGATLGVDVSVGAPEGYHPAPEILEQAQTIGQKNGCSVQVHSSPSEAVSQANVVYTDVWASMGQEEEQKARLKAFAGYQVDLDLFDQADSQALFMHCLPAHRGEEVSAAVADHERSVIFDQAENRLHSQKALMIRLFGAE